MGEKMIKEYDSIDLVNGNLVLMKNGAGSSMPCPFAYPRPCGTWCVHFGEISRANGDPRLDYMLTLGCCGTLIMGKEHSVVEFDSSKVPVGVGHPVNQYKEMPQPKSKSRVIAWSETFRYANLVKVYNQCRRKRKWKSPEEDK